MTSSDESDNDMGEEVPPPFSIESFRRNDDYDNLRILVSTDNHLGYAERDTIRGMDSFAAFEEVLYLAKRFNCDMVLIAGDLFHDNRPSRRTLHKTMEILRRHCMGPNAVKIQMLSDTKDIFRSTISGTVNYQDPHYSVDMPIFSIHGNHDDPSRDGAELLAALDLLAINNLVNYFGRQDDVDSIEVSPVLLKKGDTKIALYGLGSMRDERLNRLWQKEKVRFLRPDEEDEDDGSDEEANYLNIFMLHQNRDLGRGTKNCVQESMIPEWMDIVIWGHEHECLIDFFESVVGTFRISQPGSSVATSLVSGEAARKKIGILDINGKNFRMHPVPLTQVRSFVTTELSLREHRDGLDPDDPKVDVHVTKVLEEEVRLMVIHARDKSADLIRDALVAGNDAGEKDSPIKYKLQDPNHVLIRIRVEHTGFSTLNNQRFGAKFVGDIANPGEILVFHRKKDPKLASTVKKNALQPIAPEELEQTNVEDLVREQLAAPDRKLQLFGEKALSEALEEFVDKSSAVAITDSAQDMLSKAQRELITRRQAKKVDENESIVEDSFELEASNVSMDTATEPAKKRKATEESTQNISTHENGDEPEVSQRKQVRQRSTSKAVPSRSKATVQYDDSSGEDFPPVKAKTTTKSKPAKRAVTKRKVLYNIDESDDDEILSDEVVDDFDDDFDDAVATSSRKKAPKRGPKVKEPPKRSAATATKKKAARRAPDSDDEIEVIDGTADLDVDWGSAATKTQRSNWS